MKSLAFLPLALIVSLPSGSVLALPTRTVFAEQAQGVSGSGVNLEVPPGYGLTLNFIQTGEVVKQAWIGDPSRFVFSSNGNLCPQGLQDSNCINTGATVIFLRQIQPVDFPGLVSSADGGTQLTLITEGSEGQKQYSFGLSAVSIGKPKYTTLIIKPDSQKPALLPTIPSRQLPAAPPSMLDKLPTITSSVQRQQRTIVQNYTSSIGTATTTRQRLPLLPKKQLEQPLSIPIPVPSPSLSRENTIETNRIPEVPKRRVRALTPKRILTSTNLPTSSAQQRVATPKPRSSSLTIRQQPKVAHGSPSAVKPQSRAADGLKKAPVAPARVRLQRNSVAVNSPAVRAKKNLQQSIDDANAIAFGLRTANENGQIKTHTLMWRKAQSAIRLLRGGKTTEEAARIANIPSATLAQLIKWGQERP